MSVVVRFARVRATHDARVLVERRVLQPCAVFASLTLHLQPGVAMFTHRSTQVFLRRLVELDDL